MAELTFPWGRDRQLAAPMMDDMVAVLGGDAARRPILAAIPELPTRAGAEMREFERAGWSFTSARAGDPIVGWDRQGTTARLLILEDQRLALVADLVTVTFLEVRDRASAFEEIRGLDLGLEPLPDAIERSTSFRARYRDGRNLQEVLGRYGPIVVAPELLEILTTEPIRASGVQGPGPTWPWEEQDPDQGRGGSTSVFLAEREFRVDGRGIRIAVIDDGFCFNLPSFDPADRRSLLEVRAKDLSIRTTFPHGGDHGTQCASMAAGAGVSGRRGAAPGALLLLAKLRGVGVGLDPVTPRSQKALARIVEYCLDPGQFSVPGVAAADGAHVIVSSLGGGSSWPISPALSAVLDRCEREGRRGTHGTPVFWAISNDFAADTALHGVVAHPRVAGISACGPDGQEIPAARGPDLELLAPGVGVEPFACSGYPGSDFGTSLAAPVVGGIAALLLQAKPDLPAGDLYQALRQTAGDAVRRGGRTNYRGAGVVNALEALRHLRRP